MIQPSCLIGPRCVVQLCICCHANPCGKQEDVVITIVFTKKQKHFFFLQADDFSIYILI